VVTTAVGETTRAASGGDVFRGRLLDGLAYSITERGYRDTTVADIVRHAKTSKRTFYDQFASKEECFIELLRRDNQTMIEGILASVDLDAPPTEQVDAALNAYIDHIAARPSITLSRIREAPALGEAARGLHRLAMEHFTDMLVAISVSPGFERAGLQPVSRQLALILLGGLQELTASYVEDGRDVRGIADISSAATRALLGLQV
jgi:AcrR family transcriptional regulator